MYQELADKYVKDLIIEKMQQVDPVVYTDEELHSYFRIPHKNIVFIDETNTIISFCCIINFQEGFKMCYTWCEPNRAGMRAYVRGIDYMMLHYYPMAFGEGAVKLNKIKRMIDA